MIRHKTKKLISRRDINGKWTYINDSQVLCEFGEKVSLTFNSRIESILCFIGFGCLREGRNCLRGALSGMKDAEELGREMVGCSSATRAELHPRFPSSQTTLLPLMLVSSAALSKKASIYEEQRRMADEGRSLADRLRDALNTRVRPIPVDEDAGWSSSDDEWDDGWDPAPPPPSRYPVVPRRDIWDPAPPDQVRPQRPLPPPPPKPRNLQNLINNPDYSDCILVLLDERVGRNSEHQDSASVCSQFYAHRNILSARSPYFKKYFQDLQTQRIFKQRVGTTISRCSSII